MGYWDECRAFFREFRQQYRNTGSILPSSRSLARALTVPMRRHPGPSRILEVGPGTGPVTREILRRLQPGDQFDIVEINERFIAHLGKRFATEPLFQKRRRQVRLLHAPLENVPGAGLYDFMVSGLPLNNFPVSLVRRIFQDYRRLLKPEGILSYFEYAGIRSLKMPFVKGREKKRLLCVGRMVDRYIQAYQFAEQIVFWNVPPAIARHLCFKQQMPAR